MSKEDRPGYNPKFSKEEIKDIRKSLKDTGQVTLPHDGKTDFDDLTMSVLWQAGRLTVVDHSKKGQVTLIQLRSTASTRSKFEGIFDDL